MPGFTMIRILITVGAVWAALSALLFAALYVRAVNLGRLKVRSPSLPSIEQ